MIDSPKPLADPDTKDAPPPAGPGIADGVERRLDRRAIAMQRTIGWIVAASISSSVLVGVAALIFLGRPPSWASALLIALWVATTVGVVWLASVWPKIDHRHTSYRVDGQGIEIRKGVLWRKVIWVPRSRVQHTDVSQGPLERSYGLGTIGVYTAGTEHAKVELHGLDHNVALRIRDHLLPDRVDDAV